MALSKRTIPCFTGVGSLKIARSHIPIRYSVESKDGLKTGKGWISGPAADMRWAFCVHECMLTLEDSTVLPVNIIAHTPGIGTVYFTIERH